MTQERALVVGAITALLDGTGNRWAWRVFTSASLRDAELDRIRRCAAAVDLPLDSAGRATLLDLIDQAELVGVDDDDPQRPKPWPMKAGIAAGLCVGALLWWRNHLSGAGLFHDLHLIIVPAALGAFIVAVRNSRKQLGAYAPKVIEQNRRGRV
ncbi:MAG: hypothetical protein ABS86_06550 [Sphingobium sp. SCN 64-10]|nr:MAG: hypothetical protein ABS86_06550 [Sphingobium sp. SCN 64-10]